jgi:mannosylglycoprotein endo-beta-mannosidase
VYAKKKQGGLGIPSPKDVNLCLLASWLKRYMEGDNKLWRRIIDTKYNTNRPKNFNCNDIHTSRFFKGFLWAAKSVQFGYRWMVGDGTKIRFWEDTWFGTSPLSVQFWDLYCVYNEQLATISQVWDSDTLRLSFRRNFSPSLMERWFELE